MPYCYTSGFLMVYYGLLWSIGPELNALNFHNTHEVKFASLRPEEKQWMSHLAKLNNLL